VLALETVMLAAPTLAMSAEDTVAVSEVPDTYWVGSACPFHCTTEPETKPDPPTLSTKSAPPARADAGASEEIATGAGVGSRVEAGLPPPPPQAATNTARSVATYARARAAERWTETIEIIVLRIALSLASPAMNGTGLHGII
jgi:hypothetical protein